MNTYSRALRHIDMKDVKQKHQQKLIEQKIQEEKIKEEEKYIASVMEEKKYDWRNELEKIEQKPKEELIVDEFVNCEHSWRDKFFEDKKKYFEEGMTTSNFYTTGEQGETDISASIDVPSEFTGDIKSGHNFTVVRSTTISVDYSQYDTVSLDISGGGGAPYWSDNTAGTFLPNVYAYFYAVDSEGDTIATNGDGLGGSPLKFPPFGTLSTIDTLLNFGSNTLTIPSNLKQGNLKLVVYQNANIDPYIVGGITPPTTFNSISLRGRTPINVFVSLDSPEATSFIRTDPILSNLSPQERRKKLKEMLEAGDEYIRKMFGDEFPGSGAVLPGESRFTPQQLSDIDKQIQDLQAQSEKNKQDAINNQWRAAAELAYAGVQAVTLLTPIPGDEAIVAAAQGVKTGAGSAGARAFANANPGKYNPFLPDKVNKYLRNSHEPQGQVISEKKLKSPQEVLNKIPGYYDGKPAPLGFPVEPPPKMVNGMHPDLVDGKKVADRFNRLDPESAKAMPPTGNPHIDKKVRAARKKPK